MGERPRCEDCGTEMQEFDSPNTSGRAWSCDDCGWSWDEPDYLTHRDPGDEREGEPLRPAEGERGMPAVCDWCGHNDGTHEMLRPCDVYGNPAYDAHHRTRLAATTGEGADELRAEVERLSKRVAELEAIHGKQ